MDTTKQGRSARAPDVTTVHQARAGLAQPTRRPVMKSISVSTPWGSATLCGRIGQAHVDLLECAMETSISHGENRAGRLCVVIDPQKLRTAMSKGRARVSYAQIRKLLKEWRAAEIEELTIRLFPDFRIVTASVISEVWYRDVGKVPGNAVGRGIKGHQRAERELWMIEFSHAWTLLWKTDLPLSYGDKLQHIVAMRHGVSQAVARFMLSHKDGARYGINSVLDHLQVGKEWRRDRRTEIQADEDLMNLAGIRIVGDHLIVGEESAAATASQFPCPPHETTDAAS